MAIRAQVVAQVKQLSDVSAHLPLPPCLCVGFGGGGGTMGTAVPCGSGCPGAPGDMPGDPAGPRGGACPGGYNCCCCCCCCCSIVARCCCCRAAMSLSGERMVRKGTSCGIRLTKICAWV